MATMPGAAPDGARLVRAKLAAAVQDRHSDKKVLEQLEKDLRPLQVAPDGEYTAYELDSFTTNELRGRFRRQFGHAADQHTPRQALIDALATKQPAMTVKRSSRRNSTAGKQSWESARSR
jgi:hypothetical protein